MPETISTRVGDRQRAAGGLRTFSGARGADAFASAPPHEGARAGVRLPTSEDIRLAGESFLAVAFGEDWERTIQQSDKLDAAAAAPLDHDWVMRRIERLRPKSSGAMRLIPPLVWHLSMVLSQPDWFDTWLVLARRCPREWLVQFCGVALMKSPTQRARGRRSFNQAPEETADESRNDRRRIPENALRIDNRRVQSMLSLGVLAWHLAEYDPSNRRYPYVIRGLPYGAWQHLVAYWEAYADGSSYLRVPCSTTLFGRHKAGARWDGRNCGYIQAWCDAGIAMRYQPNGFTAPLGMTGPGRKNARGDFERWAFVEVRLAVETPGLAPIAMGPPSSPIRKRPPEPATGELDALVDELERSWYPDEEPAAQSAPAESPGVASAQHDERDGAGTRSGNGGVQEPQRPCVNNADAAPVNAEGGREVWRVPECASAPTADAGERSRFEIVSSTAQEIAKWLRRKPNEAAAADERKRNVSAQPLDPSEPSFGDDQGAMTLVAASALDPAGFDNAPSQKFLKALAAYEQELSKRQTARAGHKKRKPPD